MTGIKCRCIKEYREVTTNGRERVSGYTLVDTAGNERYFTINTLKQLMKDGTLEVTNAKLYDRFILPKINISDGIVPQTLAQKMSLLGRGVITVQTPLGNINVIDMGDKAYVITYEFSEDKVILKDATLEKRDSGVYFLNGVDNAGFRRKMVLIPDNVKSFRDLSYMWSDLDCNFEFVGGKGVTSVRKCFSHTYMRVADFTLMYTDSIVDFESCFSCSKISALIFRKNTKLHIMKGTGMFFSARLGRMDFSILDGSDAVDLTAMFSQYEGCIDMPEFKVPAECKMSNMFDLCESKRVNIKSLCTNDISKIQGMFDNCSIDKLICDCDMIMDAYSNRRKQRASYNTLE